jgi:hypothetical protein
MHAHAGAEMALATAYAQVVEPPDVWDYSMLFSQLKAELQNEMGLPGDSSISGANLPGEPSQKFQQLKSTRALLGSRPRSKHHADRAIQRKPVKIML